MTLERNKRMERLEKIIIQQDSIIRAHEQQHYPVMDRLLVDYRELERLRNDDQLAIRRLLRMVQKYQRSVLL